MALLAYPALWAFDCPAAVQSHLWWGAGLLAVLAFGPGMLSADHWLVRWRATR
jgi:putative oxidoreductase